MNKKVIISIVIFIFITLLIFTLNQPKPQAGATVINCPESYGTEQEKANSLALFYAKYKLANPQASTLEMIHGRVDFLIQNECNQTLADIEKNGGINNYIKSIVSESIKNEFKCPAEYATREDFTNKFSKDSETYFESGIGTTSDDYMSFFEQNLIDHECTEAYPEKWKE